MFLLIIVFGLHSNTKLNKYVYVCLGLKYCSYRQKCKNRKQNAKQTKPRCVLHTVKFPSPGDGYRPRQVYALYPMQVWQDNLSINHTALLRLTKRKRWKSGSTWITGQVPENPFMLHNELVYIFLVLTALIYCLTYYVLRSWTEISQVMSEGNDIIIIKYNYLL